MRTPFRQWIRETRTATSVGVFSTLVLLLALTTVSAGEPEPPPWSDSDVGPHSAWNTPAELGQPIAPGSEIQRAIAVLQPTEGHEVHGAVVFTKTEDGILVEATVTGLTPGNHGFHVHEFGDCRDPNAGSAGEHFNPEQMTHGGPLSDLRHAGDLGNIHADEDGVGTYSWLDPLLAFEGEHSILGRAIIVTAEEDDEVTQPAGEAGSAVACGIIGATAPEP